MTEKDNLNYVLLPVPLLCFCFLLQQCEFYFAATIRVLSIPFQNSKERLMACSGPKNRAGISTRLLCISLPASLCLQFMPPIFPCLCFSIYSLPFSFPSPTCHLRHQAYSLSFLQQSLLSRWARACDRTATSTTRTRLSATSSSSAARVPVTW